MYLNAIATLIICPLLCFSQYLRTSASDYSQTLRSVAPMQTDPVAVALCDFTTSTNIGSIHSEWKCHNSLNSSAYCSWKGITCTSGAVTTINFQNFFIEGTIPSSIGNIASLTSILFDSNKFSGTIPESIYSLSNLQTLRMPYNQLSGTISSNVSSLTNLKYFDLSRNLLSGSISASISLPSVTTFRVASNLLTGTIADNFNNLTSVTAYMIYLNMFSGTIPPAVGNSVQLSSFYAIYNHLSGSLPSALCQPSVQTLILSYNYMHGSLPSTMNKLTRMYRLLLSNNFFTGTLPQLSALSSMVYLDLSYNQFHGPLPSVQNRVSWMNVNLNNNQFSGTIPADITLIGVQKLYLNNNNLTGSLPLFSDHDLLQLNLENNQLNGTIPESLFEFGSGLSYLHLENNQISGSIPHALQKLQFFNASNNRLSGQIIPLWNDSKLSTLDVSHNALTGTISERVCSFIHLSEYFIEGNPFDLDSCYPSCLQLVHQDFFELLPRCHGDQDTALCSLASELNIADKQHAKVYTNVTIVESPHFSTFGDTDFYSTYQILNSSNAIEYQVAFSSHSMFGISDFIDLVGETGSYYYTHANGPALLDSSSDVVLKLPGRSLYVIFQVGDTTSTYGFTLTVTTLYRGSGWKCVNQTQTLGGVNVTQLFAVGACEWSGVTCAFDQVVDLDLSALGLVGSLPASIGLLDNLRGLDLSFNSLSGVIPSAIGNLTKLSTLDLSSNRFIGSLPHSLSNSKLSYLTVANNKLTGSLPEFLDSMHYLSVLNLEANNFEGKLTNDLCRALLPNVSISLANNVALTCFESCWDAFVSDVSLFSHDASLGYCAPTSQPTSMPTNPTSQPTSVPTRVSVVGSDSSGITVQTISIIVVCVVVGLLLLFVGVMYAFYKYVRVKIHVAEEDIELTAMLQECPVHKCILDRQALTYELVKENIGSTSRLTPDGKTALDLILDQGSKCDADPKVVFLILEYQLPSDMRSNKDIDIDAMSGNAAWSRIVQQNDPRSLAVVGMVLQTYKAYVGILARATDAYGRKYINLASAECKEIINRALFLHERFELFEGPPEYRTSSSLIRFAFDHHADRDSSKGEEHEDRPAPKVALKFMSSSAAFKRELTSRLIDASDAGKYIITVLQSFDGDGSSSEDRAFRKDAISKGYEDYPYCIVMEAAEQNLGRFIMSQRIAGTDWDEIRSVFKRLMVCIDYLHCHHIVHGDIKPSNAVVLANSALRLIDFDSSVRFGCISAGIKVSTAYCPPEYFVLKQDGSNIVVPRHVAMSKVASSPAHDIWSLGAILYLMCTGMSLFFCDIDDNIGDDADMLSLYQWDDEIRDRKLSKITDKLARNLVSLMLTKSVERRIDAMHVLDHPFLSGKQATRLSNEQSEFDVFISYRVSTDASHAGLLYNALTQRGVKVWIDSKCLEPGKNWEVGFCEGLFKCSYFVCLASRDGMNNKSVDSLNWSAMRANSPCDNVVLEWMLALELQLRGYLKGIFPVFIGSKPDGVAYDKFYFSDHDVADVSVGAVEEKLRNHLDRQGCGLPYNLNYSLKSVVNDVTSDQGAFLCGDLDESLIDIVNKIVKMIRK